MADIVHFAVLTISDSCHEDNSRDRSGPRLQQLIKEKFINAGVYRCILPDDFNAIKGKLLELIYHIEMRVNVIFTTGGTGFGKHDVTPEATKAVLERDCPQLSMAITWKSLEHTKFAILTRGVCGITKQTLIINLPGSEKAVTECFQYIYEVLPHAMHLINDELKLIKVEHKLIQNSQLDQTNQQDYHHHGHVCPHETSNDPLNDRHSAYPMIELKDALAKIIQIIHENREWQEKLNGFKSPIDIPPFRAAIKDGYAMKSSGLTGTKKVLAHIAAGDAIITKDFELDECFKINTGAAVPKNADCIIQIEDTKVVRYNSNGEEDLVFISSEPQQNLDIRPVGCDLAKGTQLFSQPDYSPVIIKSIMASVGQTIKNIPAPKIAIVSNGNELLEPGESSQNNAQIYNSNTTLLKELLQYFGFEAQKSQVLQDDLQLAMKGIEDLYKEVDVIISSGGVSMGDKDYIKPALLALGFDIHFGRINMKPGKPMVFASKGSKYFFGLPGNPVSAFVTFHLLALPALRWSQGWPYAKCTLPVIQVVLQNEKIALDPRPEYMRATITSKNGKFYALITGNQMSSRLQSIVGADVLLHLPARSQDRQEVCCGDTFSASVLRYDFITRYE